MHKIEFFEHWEKEADKAYGKTSTRPPRALDQRSHAYSDAKLEFIVGSASDLLSHDFFERKMGAERG